MSLVIPPHHVQRRKFRRGVPVMGNRRRGGSYCPKIVPVCLGNNGLMLCIVIEDGHIDTARVYVETQYTFHTPHNWVLSEKVVVKGCVFTSANSVGPAWSVETLRDFMSMHNTATQHVEDSAEEDDTEEDNAEDSSVSTD